MRGRCGIDRDRSGLDAVRAVDIERAVAADRRFRKYAMSATDREVASGIGHRKAGVAACPSAVGERRRPRIRRIAVTGKQAQSEQIR
jgi:hypothetical protein